MMGFSVLFIFALTHIFTLCAGGNSEDLSNITESSNPHHIHHRGATTSAPAEKQEDALEMKRYLELVESEDPPKDAVLVSDDNNNDYFILGSKKCDKVLEIINSSEISWKADVPSPAFLVNKDNFEILEWKSWAEIESGQIPFYPVKFCKNDYIAKDNNGIHPVTKTFLKQKKNMQTEVLSINNDIIGQQLKIDEYVIKEEEKSEREEVLKHFSAKNMNCKSVEHVVKLDHGSDKSRAFLKGRTVGAIEASVSGKILELVNVGGKLSLKYDQSRLNFETTSNLDKVLHSVCMEIKIPPNHSCVIEIKSKTFFAQVPFSGQLTRQYKNGEERTTSITGIYDHQEMADLETLVHPCKPVPDGTKC